MSVAQIIDGKIVESASSIAARSGNKNATGGNTMDKDAFLKLLVAQLKHQDPLEPQTNTEFVSQYANFSTLEQMQNMSTTMEFSRASSYVGEIVTVRTRTATGGFTEIEGKVDFVIFENNKALLSINGDLYNASDVYAAVDSQYKTAFDLALAFAKAINELPSVEFITLANADIIDNLHDGFNAMSGYQQSFIANNLIEKLQEYVAALDRIREANKESAKPPEDNIPPEDTDNGEGETVIPIV